MTVQCNEYLANEWLVSKQKIDGSYGNRGVMLTCTECGHTQDL